MTDVLLRKDFSHDENGVMTRDTLKFVDEEKSMTYGPRVIRLGTTITTKSIRGLVYELRVYGFRVHAKYY